MKAQASVHVCRLARAFAAHIQLWGPSCSHTQSIAVDVGSDKIRPLYLLIKSTLVFIRGICAYTVCTETLCAGPYVSLLQPGFYSDKVGMIGFFTQLITLSSWMSDCVACLRKDLVYAALETI